MVYALVLGTSAARLGSSSLPSSTDLNEVKIWAGGASELLHSRGDSKGGACRFATASRGQENFVFKIIRDRGSLQHKALKKHARNSMFLAL